jgi:hypothetical protein
MGSSKVIATLALGFISGVLAGSVLPVRQADCEYTICVSPSTTTNLLNIFQADGKFIVSASGIINY